MGPSLRGERTAVDQQDSRLLNELCSLLLSLIQLSTPSVQPSQLPRLSPWGFASLLLGMSLALIVAGSVTFFIGFVLMPSVIGLVVAFYLFNLGRSIICDSLLISRIKSPLARS